MRAPTWNELSEQEKQGFTLNGAINKVDWYIVESEYHPNLSYFWSKDEVSTLINKAEKRETNYYEETDTFLYDCLDNYVKYHGGIEGKSIAILGSQKPWYEAIVLSYGGSPTTIEYNKLSTDDDRLTLMTVDEHNKSTQKFDIAISISSLEHDGLGRYGDPIDPDGDLEAMKNVRENILNESGVLFLSVPIGSDKVVFNAHRIYGFKRWPMLIEGFKMIYSSGFSDKALNRETGTGCYQPVVMLKK